MNFLHCTQKVFRTSSIYTFISLCGLSLPLKLLANLHDLTNGIFFYLECIFIPSHNRYLALFHKKFKLASHAVQPT